MTATVPQPTPSPPEASRSRYRPELQGLRALAVGLVVVYHVWFNRVSGGVDVFFLVTGFLLTGQLLRAAERGPIALRPLWTRTATRLLPAAGVVLVCTAIAATLLLPEGRWPQTVREIVTSVLFVQNWQLAADAVDYAAGNNTASVVQHFWSLSIQGQVMLVWPMLVALVVMTARGAELRGRLTLTLLGLTAASLTYSVALTASDQPYAYFHSLTRVWEFALGGLLALGIDRIRLATGRRVVLGWVGVVGLLLCGAVLQGSALFPGYAALWPTGCAALVLIAGSTGSRWGADRLLVTRPMRYLGDLSYTLYLWHWPVLVLYLVSRDQATPGLLGGLAVIGVSVVLAVLTHHLVEKPAMRPSRARVPRAPVVATALVLVTAAVWHLGTVQRTADVGVVGGPDHPGALALAAGTEFDPRVDPLPPMVSVYEDWLRTDEWGCEPLVDLPIGVCTQPVEDPERRIVIVGDSHIQQLAASLLPIAERRNWQLVGMLRGACPYSTVSEVDPNAPECLEWLDAATAEIIELQPDAVVTLASRNVREGLTEVTPPGFVERWRELDELGIPVIAMRDNPRFDFSPPDCLEQRGRDAVECGIERAAVYAPDPPWSVYDDIPSNVTFLDLSDQICDPVHCPAEIGNVLVYMDDNHITASYATTMAPVVEQRILEGLGW